MTYRLSAIALLLATLPFGASAQDECGAQMGATPLICDQAPYANGVQYTSNGELVVTFTPGVSNVGGNGIQLIGQGSDSIRFDSATTASEIQSQNTVGALLDVQTTSGALILLTEEMDADGLTPAGVTHAIRAQSDSGDISITTTAAVDAASGANPATSIGIEVVSGSGNIAINTSGGMVIGNAAGLRAQTGGSGALVLNIEGTVDVGGADPGVAVDLATGSGPLVVNILDGAGQVRGGSSGQSVVATSGGDLSLYVGTGRTLSRNGRGDEAVVELAATGAMTLTNNGTIQAGGAEALTVSGSSLELINNGLIRGMADLSGLSAGYSIVNADGATWDFNDGFRAVLTSTLGAGTFDNRGTVIIRRDNAVSALATNWIGSGNSVIELPSTRLFGPGQDSCLEPSLAGCLDLSGGSSDGQTQIRVLASGNADPFTPALARKVGAGVLVVDVEGGSSAVEHFILAPDSTNYAVDAAYGAVLDTGGLFDYALLYNPEKQQHLLTSVPQAEAVEYTAFIDQSLSIWHTTADVVAGRQADLREGATGGGWVRVVGEQSDRDAAPLATTHGNTFTYAQDYATYTRALMAGFDLIGDEHYSLGVHGGLIRASVEPEGSPSEDETTGVALGGYGGWWADNGLSIDAALNLNMLKLDHSVRDGLEDSSTNVVSLGARLEGGWRFTLSEALYLQPHLLAAYVSADIDRLELVDYDIAFEDSESLRTGVGVRLGGEARLADAGSLGYWLTARSWDETNGDGNVQFATEGAPFIIEDDLSGRFEQVDLGVSMGNADGSLTAFLSGGATFADDVDRYTVSLGARLRW